MLPVTTPGTFGVKEATIAIEMLATAFINVVFISTTICDHFPKQVVK
jgi:hypothetical protein